MAGADPDLPRPAVDADLRVTLQTVLADGTHGATTVFTLAWHRDDPLAVVCELAAKPDHPALPRGSWVVLRDLVRAGLLGPVGDGAVHLRPDPTRDVLELQLERSGRPACVAVPRPSVEAFLALTDRQVPGGTEGASTEPAVEELLRGLLER
jgi:hypothetical protein